MSTKAEFAANNDERLNRSFCKVYLAIKHYLGKPSTSIILSGLASKRHLLRMCGKLPKDQIFYYSQKNMMKNMGLPERTIQEGLKTLKDDGYIKIIRRKLVNFYEINDVKLDEVISHYEKFHCYVSKNSDKHCVHQEENKKPLPASSAGIRRKLPASSAGIKEVDREKQVDRRNDLRSFRQIAAGDLLKVNSSIGNLTVQQKLENEKPTIHGSHNHIDYRKPNIKDDKVFVSKNVQSILDLWKGLGLRTSSNGTKVFKKDIKAIKSLFRGTAFANTSLSNHSQVFTKEQINTAITRYALAATSPEYLPANKKNMAKTYINVFIYNSYANHSLFLKHLNELPKPASEALRPVEPTNEKLCRRIQNLYVETIGRNGDFSKFELNKFAHASNRLEQFYKQQYLPKVRFGAETLYEIANVFMQAIVNRFGIAGLTIGVLASDFVFNDCLPSYMTENAVWDHNPENTYLH